MPTAYELQREANIARNMALLKSLALASGGAEFLGMAPKPATKPAKKPKTKKRKTPPPSDGTDSDADVAPRKVRVVEPEGGLRRSSRVAGKTVDYAADDVGPGAGRVPKIVVTKVGPDHDREPSRADKRVHDPKTFGAIPGVPVGTWWETREHCSNDAVHAPWVAGISGSPQGAFSIALSGGYEDDVDLGDVFTFTGSGGRDLKGTKNAPKNLRTAPQSSDQTFENAFNKALKVSSETQKPVRVIRGFKLKSPFAPVEGYRYDGLYTVEKAWRERGLGGFLVCKYAFKRMPGQEPLLPTAERQDDEEDDSEGEEENVSPKPEVGESEVKQETFGATKEEEDIESAPTVSQDA
ncbi:hypothetical protein FA95DRAFT_1508426 [Auriscalpium vulgare]|uniref:Uncharacterized protein n=1 Tax=Auriscalpium vulgare TaxID=40419 RepID=A0ACB8SBE0_9AGAM|nr:hypothetical protein FA95DRAFT_1508426 [Auriscalpium vulgare]